MTSFLDLNMWYALITLTAMEIVLGIDNIIYIAISVGRLPEEKRAKARSLGIILALAMRLVLLFCISWIIGLKEPFIDFMDTSFSGRDLILLGGGLFLIGKSTFEIHHKVEGISEKEKQLNLTQSMGKVIIQVILLDIVFSFDSVITAVGMVKEVWIMVVAMVLSMIIMLVASRGISDFVDKHPTIKILALSFLLLIGVMLVVEGMGGHVGKGYIYFAMFFSLGIELLNMRYRKNLKRP